MRNPVIRAARPRPVAVDAAPDEPAVLAALAEATIDGILVVSDGRMTYFNRRFVDMWSIPRAVIESRSDAEAIAAVAHQLVDPAEFVARIEYLYRNPLETSRDEIQLLDGRVIDRYSAPMLGPGGGPAGRAWFFRDVSKMRTAQEEAELLARSGELFGSSLDVETTLGQIAQLIVPRMADWAAVDVMDESGQFRRVGAAHVEPGGDQLLRDLDRRYPLRAQAGKLRGQVVATGKPVALFRVTSNDLRRFARDEEHLAMLRQLGVSSALWVPLVARERVLGVISAGYRDDRRHYDQADLELLSEISRRAAFALDNALLYRNVERAERRQAAVAALGQRALVGVHPADLLDQAVKLVADALDVPFAKVLELQPSGDTLRLVAGVGWRPGLVGTATVAADSAQAGYALATMHPVVVHDLSSERRFRGPPLLVEHGVVSGLSVIIGGRPRPYGVLGAHTDRPRAFNDDEVNFLQAVANVLATAIDRQASETQLALLAGSERLRAAELRAVIESIGDPVVVCDERGAVVLANPAAERIFGDRPKLGLDAILNRFVWPEGVTRPAARERVQGVEALLRPHQTATGEAAGDERELWMEVSSYPVLGGEQEPAGAGTILVLRDVTAARNARAVREAFLGILSHELRTPVTTIYGGSQMLARAEVTVSEEVRRSVYEDIRAEADRLYRLVENLLVLSRVERQGLQIESEPVLLQRLLARVVEAEGSRWPEARFKLDLAAGLPPVAAEETYVDQVLRNLLSNAAKYGGGGMVEVSARQVDSAVRVNVADQGPGFRNEEGGRLFEIFYRAPSSARRASGAGIGLFVSQQLVLAMGGRIWARNRSAGGAEFGFELPVFLE